MPDPHRNLLIYPPTGPPEQNPHLICSRRNNQPENDTVTSPLNTRLRRHRTSIRATCSLARTERSLLSRIRGVNGSARCFTDGGNLHTYIAYPVSGHQHSTRKCRDANQGPLSTYLHTPILPKFFFIFIFSTPFSKDPPRNIASHPGLGDLTKN